jgi:hypothetical protein
MRSNKLAEIGRFVTPQNCFLLLTDEVLKNELRLNFMINGVFLFYITWLSYIQLHHNALHSRSFSLIFN